MADTVVSKIMLSVGTFKCRWEHFFLSTIVVLAAYLGYDKQFIQDDAYISFIYARNFAEGNGLVWAVDSNEYGYTSFLFTLLVGVLMKFGFAPETASALISFPAMLITIPLVYGVCRRLTDVQIIPCFIVGLLATNHTFLAYGTGGLEASLQLCLVFAVYYQLLNWRSDRHARRLKAMALLSAVALLTRLDSALLLFPAYAMLLMMLFRDAKDSKHVKHNLTTFVCVAIPPSIAVAALLAFGYWSYGFPFPTAYYAKLDDWYVLDGVKYLYAFIKAQLFAPAIMLAAWFVLVKEEHLRPASWRPRTMIIAYLLIWIIYLLHAGGDFMEFRFILPILPFFYLLAFDMLNEVDRTGRRYILKAAFLVCFIGNYAQPYYFRTNNMDENFIESTHQLNSWIVGGAYNWTFLGKALNKQFYTGKASDVKIAVTASGAVPYYSRLPTIDRHGLNTRDVVLYPKNTIEHISRPGHRVKARISYLATQKVTFIIDHPIFVKKKGDSYTCIPAPMKISHEHLKHVAPVFIPLSGDIYLLGHYLTKHPQVEQLIAQGKIVQHKDVRNNVRCGDSFIIPGYQKLKSA